MEAIWACVGGPRWVGGRGVGGFFQRLGESLAVFGRSWVVPGALTGILGRSWGLKAPLSQHQDRLRQPQDDLGDPPRDGSKDWELLQRWNEPVRGGPSMGVGGSFSRFFRGLKSQALDARTFLNGGSADIDILRCGSSSWPMRSSAVLALLARARQWRRL